jgi:hypothetical protein
MCLEKGEKERALKILAAEVNQMTSPTEKFNCIKSIIAREDFATIRADLQELSEIGITRH